MFIPKLYVTSILNGGWAEMSTLVFDAIIIKHRKLIATSRASSFSNPLNFKEDSNLKNN